MTKYDFAAIIFLVCSLIALVAGTYQQINKRKMQLLCRGRLNHLGTTYFIYRQNTNNDIKELKSWQEKLRQYSPDPNFGCCPQSSTEACGYQLIFPKKFAMKDDKTILFFDSNSSQAYSKDFDVQSVSWRHFQGANFLLSDGSVAYYKKDKIPDKH